MKIKCFLCFLLMCYSLEVYQSPDEPIKYKKLNNFTFGSNYYTQKQKRLDIFNTIEKHNPDLFVWLGDTIQIAEPSYFSYFQNTKIMNWELVKRMYNKLRDSKYYHNFHKKTKIIGTWNDQDYGVNDGNAFFAEKESAKQEFLNFLDAPIDEDADKRRKPGRGLYTTYYFGEGFKTVRFIILDIRFHKTGGLFQNDMLGKEQWIWLEDLFGSYNETFTFIVSPTQILPFNRLLTESWFNESRKRLFDLISQYHKNGVIFLSGDVGFAQILKTFCVIPEIGYYLYEITSSGMSNSYNKYDILFNKILPNNYNYGNIFSGYNFGEIKINWGQDEDSSILEIGIFDINNQRQISLNLSYSDLKYNNIRIIESEEKEPKCLLKLTKRFKNPMEYIIYYLMNFDELFIGLGYLIFLLFLVFCCSLLRHKETFFTFLSIFVLIVGISLKVYENYQSREFHYFFDE